MRKRYLLVLSNRIRFDSKNLGKQSVIKESVIEWFRLSVKTQMDYPKLLTYTNLELQDHIVDFDTWTVLEDSSPFDFEKQIPRADERSSNLIIQISYEVNFDAIIISRSGYTLLDVLSGVGGIQSVIYSVFSLILSYFNFNNFSSHLASRFYKF